MNMNGLQTFLILPLVIAFQSHYWISGSLIELVIRPGDNVTLYCDCKTTTKQLIVWYRNCSHENQPSLVLQPKEDLWKPSGNSMNFIPHYHFVENQTSKSYDLLIENITSSEVGLYYCGTEERKLEEKTKIQLKYVYRYGNVKTRILFAPEETHCPDSTHHLPLIDCDVCWMLLITLCPAFAVITFLLSSLLAYHLCQKEAKDLQTDGKKTDREEIKNHKEEDVCYAQVEFKKFKDEKRRLKKKKTQSFESSIYSVVNT